MGGYQGLADLHMHTTWSDGRPSVRSLLEYVARHTDLQVVAITDHDCIDGAVDAQYLARDYPFECVIGSEVSSREGHILALYIDRPVPKKLSAAETIAAIHEQGGLAIAAHPFITTNTLGKQEVAMQGVGKLIGVLPFDGVEVDNSTPFLEWANFRARSFNRSSARLPEFGNSDAHIVEAIGKSYTRFPGSTAADLRDAMLRGHTCACQRRYRPAELMAYAGYYVRSVFDPPSSERRGESESVTADMR